MNKMKAIFGITLLIFVILAHSAYATLILDLGPGGIALPCGGGSCGDTSGQTFGWSFDVTSAITVDGIGVWDSNADGIGPDVLAGLWDTGGTLLASETITSASPLEPSNGDGAWRFEDFAPQVLNTGTYYIGSVFYSSTPLAQFGTAFTTIPEISYIGATISNLGPNSGLNRPDLAFGPNGVFGPTLRTATIPEPTTMLLLGTGLIGLVGARRKVKK